MTMTRFVGGKNIWRSTLAELASKASDRQLAIAFVSGRDDFVTFREGDKLIVDASDVQIESGSTSPELLKRAYESNVEIYSLSGLHTKMLILDKTVVVGSANLSSNSDTNLFEGAIISSDPDLVSEVTQHFEELRKIAHRIDKEEIERLLTLEVRCLAPRQSLWTPETEVWLVYLEDDGEIEDADIPYWSPDADVTIRLKQGSKIAKQIKAGDTIIRIERDSKTGNIVYPPQEVVNVRKKSGFIHIILRESFYQEFTLQWDRFCSEIMFRNNPDWAHGKNLDGTQVRRTRRLWSSLLR